MRVGKIPPKVLETCVLPYLGQRRPEVLVHSGLGVDSAVVDLGDALCVLSSDPITGATRNLGWLAVNVSCNDLAANGAEPIGVMVTLLATESTTENDLEQIMKDIHRACLELHIEVLGGHTEITQGLPAPILSMTAVGKAVGGSIVTSMGAKVGDDLLLTKAAGLEGTAVLASDFEGELLACVDQPTVERAKALINRISVVPEGIAAASFGASAMHDVTEGGVLTALFEMAVASGVGVEVWADRIPVLPETRAVCHFFAIDPLSLVSSGAMLIATPNGTALVGELAAQGVPASVIGRVREGGLVLHRDGRREEIVPAERDELWRVLEARGQGAGSRGAR